MRMIAVDLDHLREREGIDRPRGIADRCVRQAVRLSPSVGEPRLAILPLGVWSKLLGGSTRLAPSRRRCAPCVSRGNHDQSTTLTRPSCIDCVEKHLGAAYVLITETRDGYAHRLRAIGHLHEAEDESQEWDELHVAIRDARKEYQARGASPDWEALGMLVQHRRPGHIAAAV